MAQRAAESPPAGRDPDKQFRRSIDLIELPQPAQAKIWLLAMVEQGRLRMPFPSWMQRRSASREFSGSSNPLRRWNWQGQLLEALGGMGPIHGLCLQGAFRKCFPRHRIHLHPLTRVGRRQPLTASQRGWVRSTTPHWGRPMSPTCSRRASRSPSPSRSKGGGHGSRNPPVKSCRIRRKSIGMMRKNKRTTTDVEFTNGIRRRGSANSGSPASGMSIHPLDPRRFPHDCPLMGVRLPQLGGSDQCRTGDLLGGPQQTTGYLLPVASPVVRGRPGSGVEGDRSRGEHRAVPGAPPSPGTRRFQGVVSTAGEVDGEAEARTLQGMTTLMAQRGGRMRRAQSTSARLRDDRCNSG